mgnify:CR=1 FL=1
MDNDKKSEDPLRASQPPANEIKRSPSPRYGDLKPLVTPRPSIAPQPSPSPTTPQRQSRRATPQPSSAARKHTPQPRTPVAHVTPKPSEASHLTPKPSEASHVPSEHDNMDFGPDSDPIKYMEAMAARRAHVRRSPPLEESTPENPEAIPEAAPQPIVHSPVRPNISRHESGGTPMSTPPGALPKPAQATPVATPLQSNQRQSVSPVAFSGQINDVIQVANNGNGNTEVCGVV